MEGTERESERKGEREGGRKKETVMYFNKKNSRLSNISQSRVERTTRFSFKDRSLVNSVVNTCTHFYLNIYKMPAVRGPIKAGLEDRWDTTRIQWSKKRDSRLQAE